MSEFFSLYSWITKKLAYVYTMTNAKNSTMNITQIFESAVSLSKSLEAIEQHETRVESRSGSQWTHGDELRRLDLLEAATIAENIFQDTVRSTQQSEM